MFVKDSFLFDILSDKTLVFFVLFQKLILFY